MKYLITTQENGLCFVHRDNVALFAEAVSRANLRQALESEGFGPVDIERVDKQLNLSGSAVFEFIPDSLTLRAGA
jgi:hypothetical protein